jgi:hypothetical protein
MMDRIETILIERAGRADAQAFEFIKRERVW